MLLVPPFHVIIIADSSFFVKDQLANFGLFFWVNIMNTKICSKCLVEKSYSEYHKNKSTRTGVSSYCKLCANQYKSKSDRREKAKAREKEYRIENKDSIKIRRKLQTSSQKYKDTRRIYRAKTRDKAREYERSYREANKDKINSNVRKRQMTDVQFKIKHSLRSRLYKTVTGKNKSISVMNLIGCDIQFLLSYLKDMFTEGMSWDNYGEWHIDHILPCSSFDLADIEQQKICFNYKNLQPLWAEDNLRKGAKIIDN
jgi:hypothetical protein